MEGLIASLRSAPAESTLEKLCDLLTRHIRREENELFQLAQAEWPEDVLQELGAAIEAKVVRVCL